MEQHTFKIYGEPRNVFREICDVFREIISFWLSVAYSAAFRQVFTQRGIFNQKGNNF